MKSNKNFICFINIIVVSFAFIFISSYLLFAKRSTSSALERRRLSEFPEFTLESYFSGEYTVKLQTWFTDTVPDRDTWKKADMKIRSLFGFASEMTIQGDVTETSEEEIPSGEVSDPFAEWSEPEESSMEERSSVIIDDSEEESSGEASQDVSEEPSDEPSKEESSEEISEEPSEEPSEETSKETGDVEKDLSGLLIFNNRCMEQFGGTYDAGQLYAKYVANYKNDLGSKVNVYSMVIPSASSIYLPDKYYKMYGGEQVKKIDYIYEQFTTGLYKDAGVIPVSIYDVLNSHKNEYIYFNTEHHWTMLGGYYAAEKFASVAGLPFKKLFVSGTKTVDTKNYTYEGKFNDDGSPKPFVGSFGGQVKTDVLTKHPDTFFWYNYTGNYKVRFYDYGFTELQKERDTCFLKVSDANSSSWYMIFMDGDNYSIRIDTDVHNGRVAVVFKDSYGNALVPMMLSSFETIYCIDFRYFPLDPVDFIQKVGGTDVVFATSSFQVLGSNYKRFEAMRRQTKKYVDIGE